ncbi:hypothetical protein MRX96_051038 [Rhipicephalus microplus]
MKETPNIIADSPAKNQLVFRCQPYEHKPKNCYYKPGPERSRVSVVPWKENLIASSLHHFQNRCTLFYGFTPFSASAAKTFDTGGWPNEPGARPSLRLHSGVPLFTEWREHHTPAFREPSSLPPPIGLWLTFRPLLPHVKGTPIRPIFPVITYSLGSSAAASIHNYNVTPFVGNGALLFRLSTTN